MKKIVVKLSGKTLNNEKELYLLLKEIADNKDKAQFYIVHGGGVQITSLYNKLGIESRFVEGLRYTTDEMMDVVEKVLSGTVNKKIVSMLAKIGVDAVGLSGRDGIFKADKLLVNGSSIGRVGKILETNVEKLNNISMLGYVVVLSPVSNGPDYEALNINADNCAEKLAIDINADDLLLVSDVAGILDDKKEVIKKLDESIAEDYIDRGIISDGMIVKVRSTFNVLKNGVKRVIITNTKDRLISNIIEEIDFDATILKK